MKYNERYRKIVDELVREGFPELRRNRIFAGEASDWISRKCLAITYHFVWFSFVNASRRLRKYTDEEVRGLLAHEMGHIVSFSRCNFFGQLWKGFRYFTSRKARATEENVCDRIAIDRGYAKGLFSVKSRKRDKGRYGSCYMSAKQVESYAKEIRKW